MALHLLAQTEEDVPALSALVQDAAVRLVDIHHEVQSRRLVLLMARYCWEIDKPSRCRAALRFEHVMGVQQRGFQVLSKNSVLDLLSLTLDANHLLMHFAGTATLRVQMETIDITLEDFGEPWTANQKPRHL